MISAFFGGAREILLKHLTLGKVRREGDVLGTFHGDGVPLVVSPHLQNVLKAGAELSRSDWAEVIFCLDLLACALPDNDAVFVDQQIQNISRKLRDDYAKTYGGSPYS